MLSLSSSFRTGTKHTYTHTLAYSAKQMEGKNNPFLLPWLSTEVNRKNNGLEFCCFSPVWDISPIRLCRRDETSGRSRTEETFIMGKAFCSSNDTAEFSMSEGSSWFCNGSLRTAWVQEAQGDVPSDSLHLAPAVDKTSGFYCGLWVLLGESGGRVKDETEAFICKWVKGERGRWRGAPHCGLNQRAPEPLGPPLHRSWPSHPAALDRQQNFSEHVRRTCFGK